MEKLNQLKQYYCYSIRKEICILEHPAINYKPFYILTSFSPHISGEERPEGLTI